MAFQRILEEFRKVTFLGPKSVKVLKSVVPSSSSSSFLSVESIRISAVEMALEVVAVVVIVICPKSFDFNSSGSSVTSLIFVLTIPTFQKFTQRISCVPFLCSEMMNVRTN